MLVIPIIQVLTPFPQQFQSWDKFESKDNMTPEFANLMDIKIKTLVLLINLNSFVLKRFLLVKITVVGRVAILAGGLEFNKQTNEFQRIK
ncbi:hypothetical protein PGH42_15650 [Legionella pneumophila]|nr:hypothetical protein PGH42_15650 [Legionella pneumophila]